VAGHFLERNMDSAMYKSIFTFIYAFHMPLFVFVSGLFHKNEKIGQKVLTYVSLGYVYKIFVFITRYFIGQKPNFYLLKEDGIPWYMFVLAAFIGIACLTRNMNQKFVLFMAVLVACFAGYDDSVGDYLILSRILVFYPFYQLGVCMDKDRLFAATRDRKSQVLAAGILIGWAMACVFLLDYVYKLRPFFTGRNSFPEALGYGGGFVRLFCYLLAVVLGWAMICVSPKKKLPVMTECGKKTLQIYFWHRPFLYLVTYWGIAERVCTGLTGEILFLLCSVPVTLLFSMKIFSFPVTQILKLGLSQEKR